ncbi:hypothetical protein XTGART2_0254 [Xanthomonas translucens pv. graminis]|uniref:Uncharacterized protein n=1 Tax=Xanthomonas graminis pv. graminis TaxID=134874 RepID=A0A1M4IA60_9XANT|nr:hypothetical protein XTG29_01263 [Xanthomonas translucens pv. graminis ART-Xtg29]SBV38966.1 hypothetical protein XTGART2_0254 [Xanthomonas translucens pv. graminis]SBV38990.1 hypothetical protein XTGART9_0257 [Xanthomonas translucens pv. graminis]SBV45661.1 hypothetical protein XTGART29_0275 [Xanthomonas translucens pv. graminis ART-Xtg29]SBV53654.1 hypothetical protein XTGART10_0255 [Xanthomonas translucens pv. graminis]
MTRVHETGRAVLVLRGCHFGSESRRGEASGPCVRMYPFGRRTSRPCRPASPSRILPSCNGFVGELANSVAAAAGLVLAAWAAAAGTVGRGRSAREPCKCGGRALRLANGALASAARQWRSGGIGRSAAAAARLLAVQRWTRHGGDRARRRCRRCRTTLPCAFIPARRHGAARSERCANGPWNPRHRRASAPPAQRPLARGGMLQPRCAGVNAARALPVQPATRSTPFWPPGGVPSNWVRAATSSACRRMRPISRMMRMSSWRSSRLATTSRL